jgi:hypothetical protein
MPMEAKRSLRPQMMLRTSVRLVIASPKSPRESAMDLNLWQ